MQRWASLSFLLFTGLAVSAEDRFYPTVDAQGHIQIIQEPKSKDVPAAASNKDKATQTGADSKPPAATQEVKPAIKDRAKADVREYENEKYIDSELLERKNFNVEEKKRFYFVPDFGAGSKVVESGGEGPQVVAPALFEQTPQKTIESPNYQLISDVDLQKMYALEQRCFTAKYLEKYTKDFKAKNNIWIQPALNSVLEPDVVFSLTDQPLDTNTLRFSSFATTYKKPKFYLPVAVFLDEKGCLLSGAWQYWSQAYPASDRQYAAVDGLITIPEQTKYMLFYRAADMLKPGIPASRDNGSYIVEIYKKRLP